MDSAPAGVVGERVRGGDSGGGWGAISKWPADDISDGGGDQVRVCSIDGRLGGLCDTIDAIACGGVGCMYRWRKHLSLIPLSPLLYVYTIWVAGAADGVRQQQRRR